MTPAPRHSGPPWLDLLAAVLAGVPRLDGALCRGRAKLFDERCVDGPQRGWEDADDAAYRHAAAVDICRACPAATDCAAWVDALPRSQRPAGVIAGKISRPLPVGRPRKVTA